ncbi:MAG: TonB-dependent receptor, partial [Capnocytophaga sp.]|nr:TonB-dependent receptor [Capnocytophaga sp.]
MRMVYFYVMVLSMSFVSWGQTTIYKGKVIDTTQKPIPYANIIAIKTSNETFIRGVITDDNGFFQLEIQPENTFYIEINSLGYNKVVIHPTETDLGTITLTKRVIELEEFVVVGEKKIIEQKVDRLVFNVEHSMVANNGSAIDVLKTTPGVQLNDDNINIVGKSSVRVLINDRIVQFSGEELINYLKGIASDNIKNIEVITTPPAKYEAEGNGGLINIVLKKSEKNTWNNQIRSSYIQKSYPAIQLGNTFNYSYNRWEALASVDVRKGHSRYKSDSFIHYPIELWENLSTTKSSEDYLSVRLGADYQLTPKSNMGFLYSGYYYTPNAKEGGNTSIFDTNNREIGKIENDGATKEVGKQNSFNVHFVQKLDTLGRSISIDLDYFNYNNDRNREFTSDRTGNRTLFQKSNNIGIQKIVNYSTKIDFEHPIKWANFTYGGKITQTKTDNEVNFFDLTNGTPILDAQKSNVFEYTENIQALYADMAKDLGEKWKVKLGLRVENTQTKGFSKKMNQVNTQKYLRFFPTIYLNYVKNQNNIFNLSYSKRIGRPSFSQLNPFRFYLNANSYVTGNPYLQPSISNYLEFKYVFKNNLITDIFLEKSNGASSQVSSLDVVNNIQVYIFENIGSDYTYGLRQTILYNPFNWWNTTNMFAFYYFGMDINRNLNFESKINNGWVCQFYTNQVFSLNQKKTIQAEVTFFASSKSFRLFDVLDPYYKLDIGFRMQF